jgi:hypothetical protein
MAEWCDEDLPAKVPEDGIVTLIITELGDSTVEALRKTAQANRRSIEEEAAMLIRIGLANSPAVSRLERADAIAAMTPKGVVQTDSTLLIRQDRDRDD